MALHPFGGRGLVAGVTPFGQPNATLAAAVERAGGLGVLDLGRDRNLALAALSDTARWVPASFGVRVGPGCPLTPADLPPEVDTVVLGFGSPWTAADVGEPDGPGRGVLGRRGPRRPGRRRRRAHRPGRGVGRAGGGADHVRPAPDPAGPAPGRRAGVGRGRHRPAHRGRGRGRRGVRRRARRPAGAGAGGGAAPGDGGRHLGHGRERDGRRRRPPGVHPARPGGRRDGRRRRRRGPPPRPRPPHPAPAGGPGRGPRPTAGRPLRHRRRRRPGRDRVDPVPPHQRRRPAGPACATGSSRAR